MATYEIEMYGVLRRLAEAGVVSIEIEASQSTVQALLEELALAHPEVYDRLEQVACAIEDELVARDHSITPDQRLALIPPVSGG